MTLRLRCKVWQASLNGIPTDEKALFKTFSNMSLIPVNPMCEDQIHPKLDPDSDAFDEVLGKKILEICMIQTLRIIGPYP